MTQFLDFLMTLLPNFFSWLNSLIIAPGVSLMGFLAALFIIMLLINNFLLRGH